MNGETPAQAPDRPAPPPAPEGAGLPADSDPAAEAKRREIERQVYERRTTPDKRAEAELSRPSSPLGEV